jgi:ABC-type enterochelin transport system permease subunit
MFLTILIVHSFDMYLVQRVQKKYNSIILLGVADGSDCVLFSCSNTRIVGSSSIQGMDVCVRLFCVYVVVCVGSGLPTG